MGVPLVLGRRCEKLELDFHLSEIEVFGNSDFEKQLHNSFAIHEEIVAGAKLSEPERN